MEEQENLEQEPYHLLPEPKKEEPQCEKGPDGKVIEEQEERRRKPLAGDRQSRSPPCQNRMKGNEYHYDMDDDDGKA